MLDTDGAALLFADEAGAGGWTTGFAARAVAATASFTDCVVPPAIDVAHDMRNMNVRSVSTTKTFFFFIKVRNRKVGLQVPRTL